VAAEETGAAGHEDSQGGAEITQLGVVRLSTDLEVGGAAVDELVEKMMDRGPSVRPNVPRERTVGELPPGSALGMWSMPTERDSGRRLRVALRRLERLFIMVP